MHSDVLKQIWKPDLFFSNEKDAATHKIVTENALIRYKWVTTMLVTGVGDTNITLSPTSPCKCSLTRIPLANLNALRVREDGQIYTSIRLTVVAACRMYLNHFPMDVQVCNLKEPGLN